MTMGLLEGLLSVVGDELTEVDGFRSTRTTALVSPEDRIATGVSDATSADSGLTVTFSPEIPAGSITAGQRFRLLSDALATVLQSGVGTVNTYDDGQRTVLASGSFAATVQPGRKFRLTSGSFSGKIATINKRVSATELQLAAPYLGIEGDAALADWEVLLDLTNRSAVIASVTPGAPGFIASVTLEFALGGNFTSESWEIVEDPDTSIPVETTLDWEDAGSVVINSVVYRYDAKTLSTLDTIRPKYHHGQWGVLICPAGSAITHAKTFTIDNGFGDVREFSFYIAPNDEPTVDKVKVTITTAMTADDVRDAVITAINTYAKIGIYAFAGIGTGRVELWHETEGGSGRIDVVDTVAAAGFVTQGVRGVEEEIFTASEVVDFSKNYSAFDQYFRSFVVETADGQDLDIVGRNVSVPRDSALASDLLYRRLIKAIAYAPRGTIHGIELALEALLGAGNFEILENLTDGSPLQEPCTVFVRRRTDDRLRPQGKFFLEGEEYRQFATSTTVTVSDTPIKVTGVRLADEPHGRRYSPVTLRDAGPEPYGHIIDRGSGASSVDGETVTLAAGSFSVDIYPTDIFVIESGPYAGKRATVKIGGTPLTLVAPGEIPFPVFNGAAIHRVPGAFSNVRWRVVRPLSIWTQYKPSEEVYQYGSGTPVTPWVYTGGGTEASRVVFSSSGPDDDYLRFQQSAVVTAVSYQHDVAADQEADISFTAYMRYVVSTLRTAASVGKQAAIVFEDGTKYVAIGADKDGSGNLRIGAIDSSGAFIGTPVNLGTSEVFRNYTVRKLGNRRVQLLINGTLRQETAYSAFSSSAAAAISFGVIDSLGTEAVIIDFKTASWAVRNHRDYLNARVTGSTAAGNPARVSGGSFFDIADDDPATRKRVRVRSVTVLNAYKGCGIGEWDVDAYVSSSDADLVGPQRTGAHFNANFANRVYVSNDSRAFMFPYSLGNKLVIESGPNAGTYTITNIIDPNDDEGALASTDIALKFPLTFTGTPAEILAMPKTFSHVVEVTPALPAPQSNEVVAWHLVPVFPTDPTVEFELVDAASTTGTTVTLRQSLPAHVTGTDWLAVEYTRVDSAHLEDELAYEIQTSASGASSVDGKTITFPGGTLTNSPIHVGEIFRVFIDSGTGALALSSLYGRIESVGPGDLITLEGDGLGAAITNLRWKVLGMNENDAYATGQYLIWPAYLYDNLGYVRDVVDRMTAAGVIADFDRLYRDLLYETGIEGLHLLAE